MGTYFFAASFFLGIVLQMFGAAAASPADDILVVKLPKVSIRAKRLKMDLSDASVITEGDIKRVQARNLGEILRQIPGVDAVATTGGNSTFSIRGGSGAQTLVLIDGMRANDPSDVGRSFDFSRLPSDQIERIEILKGPQTVAYGSDALAGVVLITTKSGAMKGAPSVQATLGGGTRMLYKASANTKIAFTDTQTLSFSALHQKENLGSIADVPSGDTDYRISSQLGAKYLLRPSANQTLALQTKYNSTDQDLDEGPNKDALGYRSLVRELQSGIQHAVRLDPVFDLKTNLGHQWLLRNYTDSPTGDAKTSFQGQTLSGDTQLHANYASENIDFETATGVEMLNETASVTDQQNTRLSVFIDHATKPGKNFKITTGIRGEKYSGWRSILNARGGLEYRFDTAPTNTVELFSYLSKSSRAPSLFSRFDPTYGNPDLLPEQAFQKEIGLRIRQSQSLTFEISFFNTIYKNVFGYDAQFRSLNAGEAEVYGFETELKTFLNPQWLVRPHFTYIDATNRETDDQLPQRPNFKFGLQTDYFFSENLRSGIDILYKGERTNLAGSPDLAPAFTQVDFLTAYRYSPKIEGRFQILNALNNKNPEIIGYTFPSRAFQVEAKINL